MLKNGGWLKNSLHSRKARGWGFDSRSAFLFREGECAVVLISFCWASWCVWFHNRLCLDLIDYSFIVHCCTTYDCIRMYLYIPAMYFCCCYCCVLLYCCCCSCSAAACRCYASSYAGWQNLLLWSIESDTSVFFLSIQTRFIVNVPLGSTL